MTLFGGREAAAEREFITKKRKDFKIEAKRDKLLGLWVAEMIGKSGGSADSYALEVVKSDLEEAGDDDVFRKVRQDLDAAGVDISDEDIRLKMAEFYEQAKALIEQQA